MELWRCHCDNRSYISKWKVYVALDSFLIGIDILNSLNKIIRILQENLLIREEIISRTLICDVSVSSCSAVSVYEN